MKKFATAGTTGWWVRGLLIVPLLAAGITTVLASPASADVPDRETVWGTSLENDSEDDKTAFVECPGDTRVVGSGAVVGGEGQSSVILDELIPSVDTVTAHAYESEYRTSDSWYLQVWAICGHPRGTVVTSTRMSSLDSNNKGVTAPCPAGKVVLGTGFQIEGARGEVLVDSIIPTTNSVTVSGYEVAAGTDGAFSGSWSIRAFATCGDEPGGRTIVSRETPTNSDAKYGLAPCDDKVVVGAGFEITGPHRGTVTITDLIPATPWVSTHADEVVPSIFDWSLRTYAICASS